MAGTSLFYEGFEKLAHKLMHNKVDGEAHRLHFIRRDYHDHDGAAAKAPFGVQVAVLAGESFSMDYRRPSLFSDREGIYFG